MASLIGITLLVAIVGLWSVSVGILDQVRTSARQLCRSMRLQFIDDSVRMTLLKAQWRDGRLIVRQIYAFDFSPGRPRPLRRTGDCREPTPRQGRAGLAGPARSRASSAQSRTLIIPSCAVDATKTPF